MLKSQACREITHSHSALLAANFSPHQAKISIKNSGVRWYYCITLRTIHFVLSKNVCFVNKFLASVLLNLNKIGGIEGGH